MARKRTAANASTNNTLDSWVVPRDQREDDSDEDEIVGNRPRKRRVLHDPRTEEIQNRIPIAWVQLPAREDALTKGFQVFPQSSPRHSTPNAKLSRNETELPLRSVERQPRRKSSRPDYTAQLFDLESQSDDVSEGDSKPVHGRKTPTMEDTESDSDFGGEGSPVAGTSDMSVIESSSSSSIEPSDASDSETDVKTKRLDSKSSKPAPAAPLKSLPGKSTSKKMKSLLSHQRGEARGLDTTLPPLFEIDEMFKDLVQRANGIGFHDSIKHLQHRKLRVATMCSGTESPLLAIQMIRDALKALSGDDGLQLQFEHLFSGEIVPFKQAYIERNFQPPIIFRDITELIDALERNQEAPSATTAYGGKVPIPTNIDVLIAGTSCVDFSLLNLFKKGIDEGGESDRTWHAVLAYCRVFRPAIVILENVRNAQWDTMLEHYGAIGYECSGVLVNTKDFYIPQTRQRGYMVCFDKERIERAEVHNAGQKRASLMEKLKRPASAPATDFMIPNDQLRSRPQMLEEDQALREVDWTQCEITQMEYRQDKRLGNARPYTHWQESGSIMPPDRANARWYADQVERVLDTIDAAHLRKALEKHGMFDSRYKSRTWNLSQNIYRDEDNQPFGLLSCITPTGLFFVSDIGRPLTAEELLKLQGLPINRISFTTETSSEMQDLAGNAMSTTVVGSAILAALIVGHTIIDSPYTTGVSVEDGHCPPISLDNSTGLRPMKLKFHDPSIAKILGEARRSLRRCYCEGSSSLAEKAIQRCSDCGHTTCVACGGNPAHSYQSDRTLTEDRLTPAVFEDHLRSALPLALKVELDAITKTAIASQSRGYREAVEKAAQGMFTFQKIRRTHCWTAIYGARYARLELVITQHQAQWRLYALPLKTLAGNSPLRAILQQPIAKAKVQDSLLDIEWYWRLPISKDGVPVEMKGSGVKHDSWWCQNGMPDFKNHSVWEYLDVRMPLEGNDDLAHTINGRYQHLLHCGKACDSLYKKITNVCDSIEEGRSDQDLDQDQVFLFLDPSRTGPSDDDCFVFSYVKDDLESDEIRPILARVDASWRPWSHEGNNAKLIVDDNWIDSACQLWADELDCSIALPAPPSDSFGELACAQLHALIRCDIPVSLSNQVIRVHDDKFFSKHAWIFEVLRRNLPQSSREWQDISTSLSDERCEACAPSRPLLRWRLGGNGNGNIQPYEDPETATRYERAIKSRPDPIVVETGYGSAAAKSCITLGLDIPSLAHRAIARLADALPSEQQVDFKVSWRFITRSASSKFIFRPFKLQTTNVEPHNAEVGMSVCLFPKQCVALAWMRKQEVGVRFRLEDTEEVTIPSLGWRAEVLAQADVTVRGGICADHPGFGKTITSIALIHSEFRDQSGKAEPILSKLMARQSQEDSIRGLIPVAATLIVCPQTLLKQWVSEIEEKLGSLQGVIAIATTATLAKFSIDHFKKARIILVSRSVLGSETYTDKLAAFAAIPPPATTSGRSFAQWLKFAAKQVPVHLELLGKGKSSFKAYATRTYAQNLNSDVFKAVIPSKRLRGAAYAAEAAKKSRGSLTAKSKLIAPTTIDTTNIDMPLFEMFYFNRLIVDEFHQYDPKEYASIVALKADSRWGLSATPALGDFYDISQIARLLGVSLPIGSDQRGIMKEKNGRELGKEMTDFERFDAMRVVPTNAMHERIHAIDQRFLDTFVRQNIMDFDELIYEDHLVPVTLDLAHRTVYTELSQHLNSANMRIKKGSKSKTTTDRQILINDAISTSVTAEEALSKAAAYSENADLHAFIKRRQHELNQLLTKDIPEAVANARSKEEASFEKLKSRHESDMLGDTETTMDLLELFKGTVRPAGKPKSRLKAVRDSDEDEPSSNSKMKGTRALTAALNVKCSRLVVARRSLRYLENVLRLQGAQLRGNEDVGCDNGNCDRPKGNSFNGAVSSFCGHTVCGRCYSTIKLKGTKQCPAQGCTSALQDHHLLWMNKIGASTATPYGAKIETAVRLLKDIGKRRDQAILFVQFSTQLNEVEAALDDHGIPATIVKSLSDSGKQIQDFRDTANTPKHKTVIVLNASDETAAGSNLQNANHVIFLSPLLRDTKYGYESTMAQAIGRVRRHGQKKEIHVYRLVALDTIDVDILEHRERRSTALVERGAPAIRAPGSRPRSSKRPVPERIQLVREDGRFSLRPRSWLVSSGEQDLERVKGKNRVLGWEDFSSLVKFSRAFTEDDD